jgi:hypothetical protein
MAFIAGGFEGKPLRRLVGKHGLCAFRKPIISKLKWRQPEKIVSRFLV